MGISEHRRCRWREWGRREVRMPCLYQHFPTESHHLLLSGHAKFASSSCGPYRWAAFHFQWWTAWRRRRRLICYYLMWKKHSRREASFLRWMLGRPCARSHPGNASGRRRYWPEVHGQRLPECNPLLCVFISIILASIFAFPAECRFYIPPNVRRQLNARIVEENLGKANLENLERFGAINIAWE